jgi:Domain of unknown function (DUF4410)
VVGTALTVQGEFIAVSPANARQRVLVGLGRGASDIKTHVIVSLVANGSRVVLLDCNISSQSGKQPGALFDLIGSGGGASFPIGVATGYIGDKRSSTAQADASRTAKLMEKQIEEVMVAQKWLPAKSRKFVAEQG